MNNTYFISNHQKNFLVKGRENLAFFIASSLGIAYQKNKTKIGRETICTLDILTEIARHEDGKDLLEAFVQAVQNVQDPLSREFDKAVSNSITGICDFYADKAHQRSEVSPSGEEIEALQNALKRLIYEKSECYAVINSAKLRGSVGAHRSYDFVVA